MSPIELVRLTMEQIDEGLDDRINMNTVAARIHYSPYHLHRVFQHITGMSLTRYIREKRLERSADMLLGTDRSVLDICLMNGFGTSQTFNRVFKKKFGLPPMQFRSRGTRCDALSPERVIREYYYRIAKGAYSMLQPYIVNRETFLMVGQRVTLGGSTPSKEGIGWLWENAEKTWNEIHNKIGGGVGVSLDFKYGLERGEEARRAYLFASEVTKVEKMAFDHESLVVPASQWAYVPVRYDDPFVKNLAPPERQEDPGYLSGCVFGWIKLWCKENGYEPQNWPMELEIYGLTEGYGEEGGPQVTICIPVRKS